MITRHLSVAWMLAVTLTGSVAAATIEVEARLEPTLVGVGQFATLSLEARVQGGIELELDPRFSLENLEIVAGPSQSQQVSFVNGRVSRSQTLSWTLRGLTVGPARVRELALDVNGEVFALPEQALEVQKDPVELVDPFGRPRRFPDPFEDFFDPFRRRRQPMPEAEPKLFLRAEATPRSPYVGQQVLYSLLLFTQTDIGSVSPDKLPDFEGLWAVDIEQPQRPKSVMTEVQGERYGRVVLLQKALFPLRPGRLELQPVEARLVAKIPDYSWLGMASSFDKEFALASNPITLDVQALPQEPPGFRGAVGDFDLEALLEPRSVTPGDAATLTVRLSGRGHIDGLPGPELPKLEGVKVFPPQKSGGGRAVGTTIRGERTWTYVLVPERAGVWEITLPEYWFFDPEREAYRHTEARTHVLVARRAEPPASTESEPPAVVDRGPGIEEGREPESGDQPERAAIWRLKPWLGAAPVALVIALLVPVIRRVRARRKTTARLRHALRAAADLDRPRVAAQAMETAWGEFFRQRWSFPPGLSPGAWAGELTARGVAPETISEVTHLVDDLHFLRYAPELSAYDELRAELVERSLRLARILN